MSKNKKVLLGIATLWPIIYFFLCMIVSFGSMFISTGNGASEDITIIFFIIFALYLLTIFLILALLIIYIINVFKNNNVPNEKKALWAVVLFIGNIIAMPIYFYLYIWKDNAQSMESQNNIVK